MRGLHTRELQARSLLRIRDVKKRAADTKKPETIRKFMAADKPPAAWTIEVSSIPLIN